MVVNQETCDTLRLETLNKLDGADPSPQMVDVVNIYAKTVDNRDGINNYKADIQFITKNCTKMANPRLWKPVSSTVNLDKLMLKLKLDWPRKKDCQAIIDTLDEIEQSYSDKIRPASVANTKKYTTHEERQIQQQQKQQQQKSQGFNSAKDTARNPILDDERLKNIDPNIAERILNEVIDKKQNIKWDDIAGLRFAKTAINEIVVYPMLNPSVFRGLLAPAKGLLLFGPPGTGKTLIGKCIANESRATFFAISASSLTSKWVGEGEKMVRALFAVARCLQPSVVFIDEIDSMLTHRTDNEHDSSRRMKTEFLVQFDGVSTETEDRILIIGATNRPQELDEAARRRFTKRLYIPLPDKNARAEIIERLLIGQNHSLTKECAIEIASKAEGYSGADMTNLCKEAAMEPIRTIIRKDPSSGVQNLESASVPPISKNDFENALKQVKASVSNADLNLYLDWNRNYGSVGNEVIL